MRVWVIGSAGMLGSALMACCKKKGIEALGTTRKDADICDKMALTDVALKFKPTHIVNCAAYVDVDGAEREPAAAFAVNAEGAENVARIAKECGARLIHLSTDYVFAGIGTKPFCEEDLCAPINVYGMSKWEGEKKVNTVLPQACIIRTSWLFGSKGKNLISSLIGLFQEKEELSVVCDQLGKPTYAPDLAHAILPLLDQEGVVHFANGNASSRYQIALDLLEAARGSGLNVKCKKILPVYSAQFQTFAKRPTFSVLDTNKYERLTSTSPRPWNEAIIEYLSYGI